MNNGNSNFTMQILNVVFAVELCSQHSALVKSSEDELKTNHVYSSWLEFC